MANWLDFEVKITGTRAGQPLRPELLDVDEWIKLLQHARDLLYPEGKHPQIGIRMEPGSARLLLSAEAGVVIQAHALLEELNRHRSLSILKAKQREVIYFFQRWASEAKLAFQLGQPQKLAQGLLIDPHTSVSWIREESVWVTAELYLTGTITRIGGKAQPSLHLDTPDYGFGTLIVAAPQSLLADDSKNRLYKKQQLRIQIQQQVMTGEFDPKSAALLEFIDFTATSETPDAYLDRLIQQAAPRWSAIDDPEKWLKEVRGYEA